MTRRLSADDAALVTAREAAAKLGVSTDRLRDWKRRGLLTSHGRDHRGRSLFSLRECWEAEFTTRQGQGARRKA